MHLLDIAPYLTPIGYLLTVCALLYVRGRCPGWVHAVAAPVGIVVHAALVGWVPAVVSAGVGLVALLFAVYFARGLLTATGVFTVSTALAVAPVGGWFGLGAGVLLAAVVGTVRTIQVAGVDRVRMLTTSTAFAMGLTPGGMVRPNREYLPRAEDTAQIVQNEQDARAMRLVLPPYLLGGLTVAAVLAVLL